MIRLLPSAQKDVNSKLLLVFFDLFLPPVVDSIMWFERVVLL